MTFVFRSLIRVFEHVLYRRERYENEEERRARLAR